MSSSDGGNRGDGGGIGDGGAGGGGGDFGARGGGDAQGGGGTAVMFFYAFTSVYKVLGVMVATLTTPYVKQLGLWLLSRAREHPRRAAAVLAAVVAVLAGLFLANEESICAACVRGCVRAFAGAEHAGA